MSQEKNPNSLSRRDFLKVAGLGLGAMVLGNFSRLEKLFNPEIVQADGNRDSERLRMIEKYGIATRLPAFEFHGDNYYFYDGAYCMDPDTFSYLMHWFSSQEIWSATADEVVGYLNGNIDLPARSIILTADSGNTGKNSIHRMIPVLRETGMHFISFIYTKNMLAGETVTCVDDSCWDAFRDARDSGVFSFGTHTESHKDMATLKADEGIKDIKQSIDEIQANIGVTPNLIGWPYESVPDWADQLSQYGIVAGFAGNSRHSIFEGYIVKKDPQIWNLPRLLPPNSGSRISGRPTGKSIEQIMEIYSNGFDRSAPIYPTSAPIIAPTPSVTPTYQNRRKRDYFLRRR